MMPQEMPESDWKQLRKVFDQAYARFCSTSIQEAKALLDAAGPSDAEKFVNLRDLIKSKSKDSRSIFDSFNFSRSNAMIILVVLANWNLITMDDLKEFSQATQDRIRQNLTSNR